MRKTRRRKNVQSKQVLTGVYDAELGRYYIRQVGNRIWWAGINDGTGTVFTNVFRGTLNRTRNRISGRWADVPRGTTTGNGILRLRVLPNRRLVRISQTGGFGDRNWTFVKPQGP